MCNGISWTIAVVVATFYLAAVQLPPVQALIPIECAHNVTKPGQVCCPLNPHNGLVCGGPERGFCQEIAAPKNTVPSVFWVDDRLAWPTRYIEHACQCKGKYFGVSCEQCWFGWTGPHCEYKEHRIRRDIRHLSPFELHVFKDVVSRSNTWPSKFLILDESTNYRSDPITKPKFLPANIQYYITFLHAYSSRSTLYKTEKKCEEYAILDFNHDGVTFPTWHRYFALVWERLLGEIALKVHGVKDFSLPFYDWVGMEKCDICTNKYIGAPGKVVNQRTTLSKGSPFHNMTDYCHEPEQDIDCVGCQHAGFVTKLSRRFTTEKFPSKAGIDFVMNRKHYFVPGERDSSECESFHMALEGFCGPPGTDATNLWAHNTVHIMIEGSMASTATATNDPIFILHHSFVDKLFSLWYRRNKPPVSEYPNKNVRPGHSSDALMIGIFPLARNIDMFVDVNSLGYDYEDADSYGNFAPKHDDQMYNF